MEAMLFELFGKNANKIVLELVRDGPGKGADIVASMIACSK